MAFLPFRDRMTIVMFRWPAIIAGLFVALGIHIVLTAFGLGIAFADRDPLHEGMTSIGLLVWSGVVWIAASFVGGYVAAWIADSSRYLESLFHGFVLWGVLTFVLMFLPPSTMGVGATLSGAAPTANIISLVAWFVAIGGILSLGTTIWGAIIGSRVVAEVETKTADTYRAA